MMWPTMNSGKPTATATDDAMLVCRLRVLADPNSGPSDADIERDCASAADRIAALSARVAELEAERDAAQGVVRCFMGDFDVRNLDDESYDSIEKRARNLWDVVAERDAARKDAERWKTMMMLWTCYVEVVLTQDEDGRWSISGNEGVECMDGKWTGDDPDAAIDAAIAAKEG